MPSRTSARETAEVAVTRRLRPPSTVANTGFPVAGRLTSATASVRREWRRSASASCGMTAVTESRSTSPA